jgi:pimeloyl-ACP methyl ester carboxylesterase
MGQPFHTVLDVPVAGGTLAVGLSGPAGGAPVVLAVHGITGSHRSWSPVARHLGDDVTFLAPDLRGRGASGALPGPYGLASHIEDLVAVLDHVGATPISGTPQTPGISGTPQTPGVVLAGHSMGAFVVAGLAAAHPARVHAVALVDGGLVLPVPEDVDSDKVLEMVLGPALARLRMTFETPDAYRDFWRAHPAFSGPGMWGADVEDYVDYDLAGPPGQLRSRVSEVAVRADGADLLDVGAVRRAFMALACPTVVVRAPRGLLDEPNPLLPEAAVAEAKAALPHLVDVMVPDTNHYQLLLGDREAKTVADQLRALCGG